MAVSLAYAEGRSGRTRRSRPARDVRRRKPQAVRWSSGTEKPRSCRPPGATDCHFHTYDRHYPVTTGRDIAAG